MLFQASLAPSYWVESLQTDTYHINRLATKTSAFGTPTTILSILVHICPTTTTGFRLHMLLQHVCHHASQASLQIEFLRLPWPLQ